MYLFSAWAQTWIPWIAFVAAGVVSLGLWMLTFCLKRNFVVLFCLMGGVVGSLTHVWAVYRGIVAKPPMLQGRRHWQRLSLHFLSIYFIGAPFCVRKNHGVDAIKDGE